MDLEWIKVNETYWTQGSWVEIRPRTMDFKGDKIRSMPSFGGGSKAVSPMS
jgi:hypothetical protein